MMKKTYKSSLLALSVLASFTSCSESESLQQANLSKDKITFHATLDNSWKPMSPASSSRAAIAAATEKGPIVVSTPFGKPLYLHPVVQDGIHIWSKEGKPITRSGAPLEDVEHERVAQTRGSMKDNIGAYGSFGVTAIYKNGENNLSLFQEENGNPKIAVATSTNEDKVWEIKDSRWPVGSEVSFHAFAPYSAGSTSPLSFTPDVDGEKTQIKYIALTGKEEIKAQPDLILATAKGSQSDNALDLNFNHALTAVTFAIDKDLADVLGAGKKLTSITLSGIPNEGTYELAVMKGEGNAAPEWQFAQDGGSYKTGTYTFDLKDQDIVTGKDFALTSDNNTLMMMPQTLPESAKLNFQFELDGVLQSLIIDMKDQVWQPGKSVIYKLSAKAINTLSNPEVVYPTTWTAVGYPKQSFNNNEAIGLYAVSKDGLVVIPNVKLTKGQDGNWKTENDQRFLFTTNYSYFAYYPYRNTPDPLNVNVKATTADEFFKDMITNWNPVKEQKTKDILLSQDLQVGEGVIDGDASTLTFNMEHSMGLAVLNLKSKEIPEKRIFLNNDKYTYYYPDIEGRYNTKPKKGDYTDYPKKIAVQASTNFTDNIPYNSSSETEKKYLQIVKANQDVVFKAADQEETNRTAWGFSEPSKSTFNVAKNSCMTKDIESEAEFYYFSHYWKYTGKIETFTAPEKCDYKLECWGAQGGGIINQDKVTPAKGGGYSYGTLKNVSKGKQLFVCVGGQGTAGVRNQKNASGGYNGGGKGGYGVKNAKGQILLSGGGGGGATHIALSAGLLTQFVDKYQTQLLIVAGGAAGYSNVPNNNTNINAAYGGGVNGGPGMNTVTNATYTVAGQNPTRERFGKGQDGRNGITGTNNGGEGNSGGGGGFCGGYSDQRTGSKTNGIGGGGSGYVNTSLLVDAKTIAGNQQITKPNGVVETGHLSYGEAVITWLGKNPSTTK